MFDKTGNPALSDKVFDEYKVRNSNTTEVMTIEGTTNRIMLLFLFMLIPALFTWHLASNPETASLATILLFVGLIGGLIFALITSFKREWSQYTAPVYALFEGLFLGGFSAFFEKMYPGIVLQAVALTFGIMFILLFIYKTRIIKVTNNFRMGIMAATGAIMLIYIVSFVLGMFGINIPYIHEGGWIGIGFSLFVVVIASLSLVLDFDFIENACKARLPKYMEWYGAFALMVTLVWLYIEIVRLIYKIRG